MTTYSSWVTIFWSIFYACCAPEHPFFSGFEAEKGLRVIHACVVYTPFYSISFYQLTVNPFPNKPWFFTCLPYKPFENTVGKGEIARIE